jgi:hypothetical protein
MFVHTLRDIEGDLANMSGFPSPFGGSSDGSGLFDEYDEFVPEHIPEPGWFLEGHDLLVGDDHVAVHETTTGIFDDRGVYDMTFGYNLARLNLDTRHPDAGYRYAEDADDPAVLRAEFTPTTPFCPQSDTLTKGSFRAWNGLSDRHEYDLVRVRVVEMHHRSAEINATLENLEAKYRETGSVTTTKEDDVGDGDVREGNAGDGNTGDGDAGDVAGKSNCSDEGGTTSRGYGPDAPF